MSGFLDDAVATVNADFRAGHESGGVAGEEDDGTGEIFGFTHTAHGRQALPCPL